MSIYNILNKLNSLMPKQTDTEKTASKPVYESVEARGSVKQGLEQRLTERYLSEKAVSKSQQQAAGAALATKRGEAPKSELKGASKDMMGMSTKELEKFAGTKHKGLPKQKTTEGVNVSDVPAALRKQKGYPELTVKDLKKSQGNLSDRRTLEKMPGGETGRYRKELDEQNEKEIDYNSLEIDGIDYRDAPEFSDAYFSDGYYTDGTPLSDQDLERLTADGDLLYQMLTDIMYEGDSKEGKDGATRKHFWGKDYPEDGYEDYRKTKMDQRKAKGVPADQANKFDDVSGNRKKKPMSYDPDTGRRVAESDLSEASDYMNDLIKFTKVVRSVQTPEQLKVAQRMGKNLLQKYRGMPDNNLDKISSALGHGTFGSDIDRMYDVDDELHNKKKEMGLSEGLTPENIQKFVKKSLHEATGRVHKGKYGTAYQGDEEPADGEEAPRKRGRPAKGEVRKPKAEPAGEKRGRGRPKKDTDPQYTGAKELQGWIVGNVPKSAKNLGKKTKHTLPDTVTESVMMVEAGDLDLVLNRFKHEVRQFRDTGQLDDDLYQALLDHYYDAGEMPRTVRNGRTGDPRDWVTERLAQDLGITMTNDVAMAETDGMDSELNELARLAGLDIAESKAEPDFLDLDKDGDKIEPMSQAAADKKADKQAKKHDYKQSFEKGFGGSAEELTKGLSIREDEFTEDDMEEGNEFSGALAKAKASGADEFEVDGKTYPVKGQQVDELSKSTLGSYVKKASKDAVGNTTKGGYEDEYGTFIDADRHYKKADKRLTGIDRATDRLTKTKAVKGQQVDELSSDTLKSYMDKAGGDIYKTGPGNRGDMSDEERRKQNTRFGGPGQGSGTRFQGHRRAGEKVLAKDFADTFAESAISECGDMPAATDSTLNVSTNMSSTGDKNVTISASGDQAEALLAMLKMAGLGGGTTAQSLAQPAAPVEISMEEEYANEPDTEIQPVDAIVRQGNDLNREKQQYADKPRAGDNPMATMEQVNPLDSLGRKLMQAYESIKAKK